MNNSNDGATKPKTFTIDDREVDIREDETIFRAAASRSRICATRRNPVTGRTAIAASAWWRSKASACWRQAASARLRPA
jgi:hypothetical protein